MSTLSTRVVEIEEVMPFPDPETHSLVLARIGGWYCVCGKDSVTPGEKRVFVEPDSVLPKWLEDKAWEGTKISRPKDGRIKAVKIRGVVSPGLLLSLETCGLPESLAVGTEVHKDLGITKYAPPEMEIKSGKGGSNTPRPKKAHIDFARYTDIENIKRYNNSFKEGEPVSITLKLHGTSFRAGWCKSAVESFVPWFTKTRSGIRLNIRTNLRILKNKILKMFNMLPEYEFVVGSRKMEIEDGSEVYYNENVWLKVASDYEISKKLARGEVIYGEIVGKNLQANFNYGFPKEYKFFAYDAMVNGRYLDVSEFVAFCDERGFDRVPELYNGPYSFEKIEELRNGNDHPLDQNVPCREGVVVKPLTERVDPGLGRLVLKAISDKYYLCKTTDFQ